MKTITINFDAETNMHLVVVGDRIADRLTFEEALELVAAEMMPETPRLREWLKTTEERAAREYQRGIFYAEARQREGGEVPS